MHSIGLPNGYAGGGSPAGFTPARPSLYGLEMHLATIFKEIAEFQPHVVIIDPITSVMDAGTESECKGMVTRLIRLPEGRAGHCSLFPTSLTHGRRGVRAE